MTREDAIALLNGIKNYYNNKTEDSYVGFDDEDNEAFDTAIKALEQEPCEDCISRQAAIDELYKMLHDCFWADDEELDAVVTTLNDLPSVNPQPKIGEWLEKEVISDKAIDEWQSARCSVCDRYHTTPYMYYFTEYNFCPNCGAKIERRQRLDQRRSKRNR
jgi:hypothetical protein